MGSPALRLDGVVKRYGRAKALDGVSFEVPRGSICGLVGPNGAGKTTAFGVVGGYVRADQGVIDVLGEGALDPLRHAGRVNLLPQDCALNPHTTVRETLRYYARLQGMSRRDAARDTDRVLEAVDLAERGGSRVRQLSHGMRRRVQVAQAFLGAPELVLLDEPMGGLDPQLVVRMREFFRSQRGERTLLISSHVLHELEAISDHVIFMEAGRCVRQGPMDQITGRGQVLRVALTQDAAAWVEPVRTKLPTARIEADGDVLIVEMSGETAVEQTRQLMEALLAARVPTLELTRGRSLEATWMAGREDG